MLVPAIAVLLAFVAGLFIDERTKQALIPLPPRVQILGAAVILGVTGGGLLG